jgi:uncharacterized protein YbcI
MPSTITQEHHGRGSVQAAISNAVVRLLHDYTGRGPTKARTTITDDLVICVLADTMTKAERSLIADNKSELVLHTRKEFQDTMRTDIVHEVEQLTERKAMAFMSANHIDPDYAVEVVILEPQPPETASHGL